MNAQDDIEKHDFSPNLLCYLDGEKWLENDRPRIIRRSKRARCLMKLEPGLHSIELATNPQNDILIGIHGFQAKGFEWDKPLVTLNNDKVDIYFFRWRYMQPQKEGRDLFLAEFQELMKARRNTNSQITVVGHSCGGVLITSLINDLNVPNDVEIHAVAAPLAGLGPLTICKPELSSHTAENVRLTQWRTKKQNDIAFWYLPFDPQEVSLPYAHVIYLPEIWNEKRIGHLNSLEWVAAQIVSKDDSRFSSDEFKAAMQ